MTTEQFDAELRDWTVRVRDGTAYVVGAIHNDKKGRFSEGEIVRTSQIDTLEGEFCKTLNTTYKLAPQVAA